MEFIKSEIFDAKLLDQILPLATSWSGKILGALAILIGSFWIAGKVKKMTVAGMTRAKVEPTLVKFGGNIVRWAILAAAGISLLGVFGIQTASFAAVIAAMGLAIGLAFQGTLSNVASGVMLLVFRPFKVGQVINVAGTTGTVHEIDLFTTHINTPDNRRIIVPNSSVFGSTIENVSHNGTRRVDLVVGVDYNAGLDNVRELLGALVDRNPLVLKDPAKAIILSELGASSVDWTIRAWVKAEDYWTVREELLVDVKNTLDRAGIGIPFPQMDVHLQGGGFVPAATMQTPDSARIQ